MLAASGSRRALRSCPAHARPIPSASAERGRQQAHIAHANKREGGGFWTGFALGGAICGAAGFFFAPQISRAILNEQQKFRLPKWLEEDKPPVTKAELEEKIGQLHSAINEVAANLGSDTPEIAPAGPSSNSNKNVDMIQQ